MLSRGTSFNAYIINGINNVVERGDLQDRTITINLEILEKRESPQDLEKIFEEKKPLIMGGLFDLLATALRNKRDVKINDANMPRMIDYARFGSACEEYLGLSKGEFVKIYKNNQQMSIEENAENDTFIQAILNVLEEKAYIYETATELTNMLKDSVKDEIAKKNLPSNAVWLKRALNRKKPILRKIGIDVDEKAGKKKVISIKKVSFGKIPTIPTLPTEAREIGAFKVYGKTSVNNIAVSKNSDSKERRYIDENGQERVEITI